MPKLVYLVPVLSLLLLWQFQISFCQVPTICATNENLESKVCCPNDCFSSEGYGECTDVQDMADSQSMDADQAIVNILRSSNTKEYKNYSIDSRYLWPTMVFNRVCMCNHKLNRYGADCSDCAFGYKKQGRSCIKKSLVTRRSFWSLSGPERNRVVDGIRKLKSEMGNWSVIISEESPRYPNERDRVKVKNVSFYDYLVYIHNYVAREASKACFTLNGENVVDFAHSGPNFPVWHRTFLLILERAMQIVLKDENFGFPYWDWESNYDYDNSKSSSPFNQNYFGTQGSTMGDYTNIKFGNILTNSNWYTVCDAAYTRGQKFQPYVNETGEHLCEKYWALCDPKEDLKERNTLQRGLREAYLPNLREIQMILTSPRYDVMARKNEAGHKESFRRTMEGWVTTCSGLNCISDYDVRNRMLQNRHMHNVVHLWVGGHMRIPASAVNDPIFSLHHANIDRILETWMKQFNDSDAQVNPLPNYFPESGGHPGHNKNDSMVPFLPLITPGEQYRTAEYWGYQYDHLVEPATGNFKNVSTCPREITISQCSICKANSSCSCFNQELYGNCNDVTCAPDRCLLVAVPTSRPPGSSSSKLGANYLASLLIAFIVILAMSKD